MTDPTSKARWVNWPTPGLVYGDMRTGEVLVKVKMRAENEAMRAEAVAALVAAVRDADTLRQAREILADLVDDDDCSYDHHGYCQTHGWLQEGTCPHKRAKALLSPPVSPDTPTPTGQTDE